MYGIFTYIWLMFMVNVGKYTIHGWYGYENYTIHLSFPVQSCEILRPPNTSPEAFLALREFQTFQTPILKRYHWRIVIVPIK